MADKLDYKKEFPDLYLPKKEPAEIVVPSISFFMVDGEGAPEGAEYQQALQLLYSLSFTIKMSKMGGMQPEGYFEYAVPPLEGLWEMPSGLSERENWKWTSMIRQPDFVTPQVFERVREQAAKKKPELDTGKIRLESYDEGRCVQIMHHGPYSGEPESLSRMEAFMKEHGLTASYGKDTRRHHEIYLSDPRRAAPERMRTVLRIPVVEV